MRNSRTPSMVTQVMVFFYASLCLLFALPFLSFTLDDILSIIYSFPRIVSWHAVTYIEILVSSFQDRKVISWLFLMGRRRPTAIKPPYARLVMALSHASQFVCLAYGVRHLRVVTRLCK